MPPLELRQSILHTLAFFDIFDASLTVEEIHGYLFRGGTASRESVQRTLVRMVSDQEIQYDRGYYGLRVLTKERLARIPLIEHKYAIARRAVKKLRYVPFLRAVFVCNNLALETVRAESDVDVCIVTKSGRIWIARFIATVILRCARLARTKYTAENRVCLSFYVTDDALDFASIQITDPDIYLMYWVRSLVPLYDPEDVYTAVQQKNTWIRPFLASPSSVRISGKRRIDDSRVSLSVKRWFERLWQGRLGDTIETQARELQKTKMKFRFESVRDEPDSRVIVSDTMLKFHENDRRVQYREEWEGILKSLNHEIIKAE